MSWLIAYDYFLIRRAVEKRSDLVTEMLAWDQAMERASLAIPNTPLLKRLQDFASVVRAADFRERIAYDVDFPKE
jgi:hypothetical protein